MKPDAAEIKVISPESEGFDRGMVHTLMRATFIPTSNGSQNVPVRGVCFAAGPNSYRLACDFSENEINLRTITWDFRSITPEQLFEFAVERYLAEPNVGIVLSNVHLMPDLLQAQLAGIILASPNPIWFLVIAGHELLTPCLKLPFLVYLGLSEKNRMEFLVQPGHLLEIDEGSLRRSEE